LCETNVTDPSEICILYYENVFSMSRLWANRIQFDISFM